MKSDTHPHRFLHYHAGQWEPLGREVIVETPVTLTVNGQAWLTFMCTPTDLEALGVGFLYNEGVIKSRDEIEVIRVCESKDNIDVWLNHPVEQPGQWRRTSGCTGGKTAVALESAHPELHDGMMLSPQTINQWMDELSTAQELYREVGGVHTSILSNGKRVIVSAEDVGRHNTLDKIAGRCLLDDIKLSCKMLITTGRISSEMIQKASRIGASIVISRTSASSLSIRLAEKWGITLVGYARRSQFVVYTHSERILQQSEMLYEYSPPEEV